jgi:6-phosphogluconolactonase
MNRFLSWAMVRVAVVGAAVGGITSGAVLKGEAQVVNDRNDASVLVYVGTYTDGESKGIHVCRMNLADGTLEPTGQVAETKSPSFLAIHPNRRFLYAANETDRFEDKPTGSVSAFTIDPRTGGLTALNQRASGGVWPCHLSVDATGKFVLVANYLSGTVAMLPIEKDGRLSEASDVVQHKGKGVNPSRQEGPHAHSITLDAANRYAFAADLGIDKVMIYRLDLDKGRLVPNRQPWVNVKPGSGPRHFDFHPNGKFAYLINELGCTMIAFEYDPAQGVLSEVQTVSTLPEGWKGVSHCADIHVHPSGKFVYGSNRGHDSIVICAIDPGTGKLTVRGCESTRGKTPRNFAIDPTGSYLLAANQDTNNIVIFRIDKETGLLSATGREVKIPKPVCVRFMPSGRQ